MLNDPLIAIVDDSRIARHYLKHILSRHNFSVTFEADNGMDCIDQMIASPRPPDLVILDIEMPVMSGFEAAQLLKQRWPSTKIIAYSGLSDQKEISKILAAGADNFVSKDTESHMIIAAVKEILCTAVS